MKTTWIIYSDNK